MQRILFRKQKTFFRVTRRIAVFLLIFCFLFTLINSCGTYHLCSARGLIANNQSHQTAIRSDGVSLVDGEPFFPFGLYHVSWEATPSELSDALRDIATAGFNTIHASVTNLGNYQSFLSEAEQLGVHVITEQNVGLTQMIDAFKNEPAVLGWNIGDDVDDGRRAPETILASHEQAKANDPNHITYVSGFSPDRIGSFANCADVIGVQSYPIITGAEGIASTYSNISAARSTLANHSGAVYANLQAFNWAGTGSQAYANARSPTAQEVRNMTYQALLAGSKGIIYYTYYDSVWRLPDQPNLWSGLKLLVSEIEQLKPMLLNGILTVFQHSTSDVIAGIWTLNDQGVIVVVNTSAATAREFSVFLADSNVSVQPLFPNQPAGMVFESGALAGVIQPLDVHVYRLSRS